MSQLHKVSAYLVDYGERLSKVADAAEGKHPQNGKGVTRWILLPAAGAGLYALARSDYFTRQAREAVDEARSRAAELPEDLMGRVYQATGGERRGSAAGKTASPRRTTSSRKRSSARAKTTK